MGSIIYHITINSYFFGIRMAALFGHEKARKMITGRKAIFNQLKKAVEDNTTPIIWFHCASHGEFEQGKPVIEKLKENYPDKKILVTFFSPSGYEQAKNYDRADYIFYLPFDSRKNARRFLDIIRPEAVFFVKYEFWHHFIKATEQRTIPILLFSAIFRQKQPFFQAYGKFYANILRRFTHIFTQDENSIQLLQKIGCTHATAVGDTRFDRVNTLLKTPYELPIIERFKGNKRLLVIGSGWPEDLAVLLPFINKFDKKLQLIIAPHEIHESKIEGLISHISKPTIRYSEAEKKDLTISLSNNYNVLIIDNIGLLSRIYRYADFAYIGGAFKQGLHNILEPGVFGMPLFFGPNYTNFKEADDLVKIGGAFPVSSEKEFTAAFSDFYENEEHCSETSETVRRYVAENVGATDKIIEFYSRI